LFFINCGLASDVLSDEQVGATFSDTDSLPVIKKTFSLKTAKQQKDASKVGAVFCLRNTSVDY